MSLEWKVALPNLVALPFGLTCPERDSLSSGVGESACMDPPKKSKAICDSRTLGGNFSTTKLSTTGEVAHRNGRNQTKSRAGRHAIEEVEERAGRPINEATEIRRRAAIAGKVKA